MSGRPISEEELHAYVDGRLDQGRLEEVEAYLATQPELQRRVAAYCTQRDGLRSAFAARATEPIPPELNLARLFEVRLRRRRVSWRVAAAVALSLGVGGAAGWYLSTPPEQSRIALATSLLQQEALTSHAVYALDPRHPVEVAADEREHLAQWLSNRLHRTVTPPDLSTAGYRLLGGRLLATEHGAAAALFMYDDGHGNRLSVLMRPMAPELHALRTDVSQGSMNGCSWIEKGMGYAVVGAMRDAALDEVARQVSLQAEAAG